MDGWLTSTQYMPGVRVELSKPQLTTRATTDDPIVCFEVSRWYEEALEEGVTVSLTPYQALLLADKLHAAYAEHWRFRQ